MRSRSFAFSIVALFAVVLWPQEAVLGTYGTCRHPRKGYTVAKDINVGSYSSHSHEGEVYRQRENDIERAVAPLLPMFDAW